MAAVNELHKTIRTRAERRLLQALAGMCDQYLRVDRQGGWVLDHMCMEAGEEAFRQLEAYGLIDVSGRGAMWTAAGEDLLNSDLHLSGEPDD